MKNVKSIGVLFGAPEAERAQAVERTAVQNLWLSDFADAPEWLVRKYFTNDAGLTCGRMHVRGFARIGETLTDKGKPILNRWGKERKLTTGYLAKKVEDDLALAGYPDVRVHFKGYSLDPVRFVMTEAGQQEEFEENEARHVPGLDEDERYEPANAQTPLDRQVWESLACFMMNALRTHTLMYWGVDEDFARVLSATDYVHVAYNAYLRGLWARLSSMMTPDTVTFASRHGDFETFECNDVIRTYTRAMRFLTGKEYDEGMFEDAWLIDPDLDAKALEAAYDVHRMGYGPNGVRADYVSMLGVVLANEDPTESVAEWEYEARDDENMFDDDSGELATGLLLRY